jgi:putative flippase GtrA
MLLNKKINITDKTVQEFIKYFFVGVSSFVLDMSSLILLKESLFSSASVAVLFNQIFIILYNFNLNKYWTFSNKLDNKKQFVKYLTLILFNYIFSVLIMYLFSDRMGIDYRIIRTGTIMVMVMWNFYIYKFWVYRRI